MGELILGTDSKRFYVKASDPKRRLDNLKALAVKYWLGNFSAMVNGALNKVYDLDPDTGEERGGSIVAEPKPPPWPTKTRKRK